MIPFRKKYSPGVCRHKPNYTEIRWDVIGCNLKCQFCWSPASRPLETKEPSINKSADEVYEDTQSAIIQPEHTFIRFTGGEPTLYSQELFDILLRYDKNKTLCQIPIIIQTNGLLIGKGQVNINLLNLLDKQKILFELSFKGTNEREFNILTGLDPVQYIHQINAYERIKELSISKKNIAVIAVLGIYHSSLNSQSKYAFIDPETKNLLFDNQNEWSEKFKSIWENTTDKWVESLRMSPKGMWDNLCKRCGEIGTGILKKFPDRVQTNIDGVFISKPKSYEYAKMLINNSFWNQY